MATQNSFPKPFLKSAMLYNEASMPRITANNQYYHHHHQQQQQQENPTSTVHKSLASSRQYGAQSCASASAPYSRLISPTISQQGSLSPQSSVEFVQHRNLNQQHQQPQQIYNQQQHQMSAQQYHQHQASPESKTPRSNVQQQYKSPVQLRASSQSLPSVNDCVRPESAAVTAEDDYKKLLARISPSSPRQSAAASNVLLPDDKRDGYMHDKQLEQLSIAHQTYRTTPIVLPKPKARHDLAKGSYMHLNQDPTWDMLERVNQLHQHQSKMDHSVKLNQSCKLYPNDVIRSLPTSSLHNINDPTNYVGSRAAHIDQQATIGAADKHLAKDYRAPVFDYRQYIDATRHAR